MTPKIECCFCNSQDGQRRRLSAIYSLQAQLSHEWSHQLDSCCPDQTPNVPKCPHLSQNALPQNWTTQTESHSDSPRIVYLKTKEAKCGAD